MFIFNSDRFIICSFEPDTTRSLVFFSGNVEIYFGITKNLNSKHSSFGSYITSEEKLIADKFHFSEDRETYLLCHGLIRSILSMKLGINPSEVIFNYNINNKPGLPGNPLYFNITHVRGAFAFVISNSFYAGIDIENTDRSINILPIINSFFSKKERKFILASKVNELENFYMLWTRKEALLKAIGTGIIDNLKQIEVSDNENFIKLKSFDCPISDSVSNKHFIYSEKVLEYYLSIAIPQKAEIMLNLINEESINAFLN